MTATLAFARVPLGAVYVAMLLVQLVINASRPMVSYRALALGADSVVLGLISASFAVVSLVAAIPVGSAVDRFGARRFVAVSAFILAVSCVVLALSDSLVLLVLMQSVFGVALMTVAIACQTLVANAGPDVSSEARFAVFTAVVSLGQLFGPLIGGGMAEAAIALGWHAENDEYATTVVFLVLAVIGVAAVPAALMIREGPRGRPKGSERVTRQEFFSSMRAPGMFHALFASLVVLSALDILTIYLPAWGEEQGWSIGFVSALLAVRAGASFAVRLVMQPVITRWGRRLPLAAGSAAGALALGAVPFVGYAPLLFALMGVVGIVLGMSQPLTMSWVARIAPLRLRSTALAVRLMANRFGQLTIPLGVGAIAGFVGTTAIFFSLGALLTATTVMVARSTIDDEVSRSDPLADD
jgi:MFS family permease